MGTADSGKPNSDSDIEDTNPDPISIPNSDSSNALVTTQSNHPAVCLLRFAGDSASGAVMGSIFGFVINAGIAGCCTGLALSFPGAPQALLQSCLTFGAFSFIIEGLNKQQPAMAYSLSARIKQDHHKSPSPSALPLSIPLPDELKGAFSFSATP